MNTIQKYYSRHREYPVQDVEQIFSVKNTVYPNSMIRPDPRLPYRDAPLYSSGSNNLRKDSLDLRSCLPGGRANFPSTSIKEFL